MGITKGNQILIATAEFFIENGKLQKSSAPISIGNRYLINTEPIHATGNKYHSKRQLSNGLWMDINFSSTNCEEQAKKLIEYFGMKRDILQVVW
jgi:hypothetical protein